MIRVDAFFDTWKTIRQDTAQAVEDFPPAEFDFKPVPELMSFREIARHILDAGHALTGVLNDGFEDLASCRQLFKDYAVPLAAGAEPAALAAALQDSLELRSSQLLQKPNEFFSGMVTRMDGQRVTRLEMLQFIKEHEVAHRAQLFLYLRLKGIVPVTTRRRQAKK
jgi:uncharacterized damage-inducible protein DinB